MAGPGVILRTIAAVLLVMLVGAIARRRGLVSAEGTAGLGRLVTDVAFPALCFKGLAGMGPDALTRGGLVPLVGAGTLTLGALVGAALAPFVCAPASRRTFVFCVAMSNWIFLPLPLADALYGDAGTAVVLLGNAGAQVFLWTAGVAILGGRGGGLALVRNPGLWATAAGIACALAWPGVTSVPVVTEGVDLVAAATIPLATLAIGAQLGAPRVGDQVATQVGAQVGTQARAKVDTPSAESRPAAAAGMAAVAALAAARLIVVPAIAGVALFAWRDLAPVARTVEILVAAMPVSVTAGALVARAGGDVRLASRAILLTTIASAVTVPLAYLVASRAAVDLR